MEWLMEICFNNLRVGKESVLRVPLMDTEDAEQKAKELGMRMDESGASKRIGKSLSVKILTVDEANQNRGIPKKTFTQKGM